MKVNPIKRFIINRRKKKTWLWHRTSKENLEKIKKMGIKPGATTGFAKGNRQVSMINRIFDGQRPRGIRLSREKSVFFDIPKVNKLRRAFWEGWATPEQKEKMKKHYARVRVNPKKAFVGDLQLIREAEKIIEKQEKETGKKIASEKDISADNTRAIEEIGKEYWRNTMSLEEYLKNYKWVPAPVGAYKPVTGNGPTLMNPEVMTTAGKTIKRARVSKGKI